MRSLRVAFLHPELGVGGAERLVVDAALELGARGHRVCIYTASHHSFPETVDGRLDVRVRGGFLPARIAGRFQAACTVARSAWLAARTSGERFDAVVCDIVPHAIPLCRAVQRGAGLVYYCHFPDQLQARPKQGAYRLYRAPLDGLELPAMRAADRVVVNSRFTAAELGRLGCRADVVYPGVDVDGYAALPPPPRGGAEILVIGRFDPRKNLPLAVEALARLRDLDPTLFARVRLHIAGALEPHAGSAEVARALTARSRALGLEDKVVLHRTPAEPDRLALLARAALVVHTTPDEPFGLVPVEAMAAARPVIAVASAGPLETVVDGETGYLCPPSPEAFAAAIARVLADPDAAARMGRAGQARARERFSRRAFGDAFEAVLADVCP